MPSIFGKKLEGKQMNLSNKRNLISITWYGKSVCRSVFISILSFKRKYYYDDVNYYCSIIRELCSACYYDNDLCSKDYIYDFCNEDGKIIEQGNFNDLMKKEEKCYAFLS